MRAAPFLLCNEMQLGYSTSWADTSQNIWHQRCKTWLGCLLLKIFNVTHSSVMFVLEYCFQFFRCPTVLLWGPKVLHRVHMYKKHSHQGSCGATALPADHLLPARGFCPCIGGQECIATDSVGCNLGHVHVPQHRGLTPAAAHRGGGGCEAQELLPVNSSLLDPPHSRTAAFVWAVPASKAALLPQHS